MGDPTHVAMGLCGLASEQEDEQAKSLLLRAAQTIELQGMEVGDLNEKLGLLQELLRGQNDILEALPVD